MIAKNEAHQIANAISSAQQIAAEIIVVDTGSSDGTIEVARSLGASVSQFEWDNNFSNARNFALNHCTGDWVLSLDCDEVFDISRKDMEVLASACRDAAKVGYSIPILNLLSDGCWREHHSLRLFRNHKSIFYTNPIHESVAYSIAESYPPNAIGNITFPILHFGYASGKNSEKLLRNLDLLGEWIKEDPQNPYALFKFGCTIKALDPSAAKRVLRQSLALVCATGGSSVHPFFNELLEVLSDCPA